MNGEELKKNKDKGNVGIGCLMGLIMIGIGIFIGMLFSNFVAGVLTGIVVNIGLIVYLFIKRQTYSAIGLIIFFGISLLLVSACFGLLSYSQPS